MELITVKVDDELKKRMSTHAHLNWSEVVRAAVEERLKSEESILRRKKDRIRLEKAIETADRVREKTTGAWSVTEEIRRWRQRKAA